MSRERGGQTGSARPDQTSCSSSSEWARRGLWVSAVTLLPMTTQHLSSGLVRPSVAILAQATLILGQPIQLSGCFLTWSCRIDAALRAFRTLSLCISSFVALALVVVHLGFVTPCRCRSYGIFDMVKLCRCRSYGIFDMLELGRCRS